MLQDLGTLKDFAFLVFPPTSRAFAPTWLKVAELKMSTWDGNVVLGDVVNKHGSWSCCGNGEHLQDIAMFNTGTHS